ncbi:MAG: AraC family transcriptional regulator [Flavobacterium sp.]|uniref:helix-turn-helix domain-containing protein n=1 Tax=Flavobacterium sp. TaxID=239 RepID=UPI0011FC31CC|nr:AraC family transcriptional regulator [Flavobacterium sp.]RZJ65145.1 MAG: AraC family transcriptional regulator [Flavobacterium sp.]
MKFSISCHSLLPPITIVKDNLERLDIGYRELSDGQIEILGQIPDDNRSSLEVSLSRYGIEIIDDEKRILVQRIKNILLDQVYGDKPTLQTLSNFLIEKLGFSYGYISGIFVSETFSSIEKYVIMLKTERAKRMIIEDELTLKDISERLGYSSVGHFSKQFKKTTGITISAFRKIITRRKNAN